MRIVTVSGFKGGTGKTTLATLLGVAAVMDGRRVAGLDLDPNTRNFGSILTRRRAAGLACPDHVAMAEFDNGPVRHPRWLESFVRMIRDAGYDLLIIDTGSGCTDDLYKAHLLADVVLTPLNDSPGDLHGLFDEAASPELAKLNYRELVESARFERKVAGMPQQQWHVCRNRVSHLPTKVGAIVQERVEQLAKEIPFDGVWCVRDRVSHKAIALDGLTVLDPPRNGPLTMSELAGRSEARTLLGLLDAQGVRQPPMRVAAPEMIIEKIAA